MIDSSHPELSVYRQCLIVDLPESSYYYRARPIRDEKNHLMRRIDEIFTECPYFGARRIAAVLGREGIETDYRRISRLMRVMGLEAIYCKKKTSNPHPGHKKYPYLLRGLNICRPNLVWCADITYIRMAQGWAYLVAVMDWFSRYVLSWRLSNTLDVTFCIDAVLDALRMAKPDIFNTDQGSQFTSDLFTGHLLGKGIKISMDGKGRVFDNIFIERLWRSIKYEEVYLNEYLTMRHAHSGIGAYLSKYNTERPHQALGYMTPWEVFAV